MTNRHAKNAAAYRKRKARGQICLVIRLDPVAIDGFVRDGYVRPERRYSRLELQAAAEAFISDKTAPAPA